MASSTAFPMPDDDTPVAGIPAMTYGQFKRQMHTAKETATAAVTASPAVLGVPQNAGTLVVVKMGGAIEKFEVLLRVMEKGSKCEAKIGGSRFKGQLLAVERGTSGGMLEAVTSECMNSNGLICVHICDPKTKHALDDNRLHVGDVKTLSGAATAATIEEAFANPLWIPNQVSSKTHLLGAAVTAGLVLEGVMPYVPEEPDSEVELMTGPKPKQEKGLASLIKAHTGKKAEVDVGSLMEKLLPHLGTASQVKQTLAQGSKVPGATSGRAASMTLAGGSGGFGEDLKGEGDMGFGGDDGGGDVTESLRETVLQILREAGSGDFGGAPTSQDRLLKLHRTNPGKLGMDTLTAMSGRLLGGGLGAGEVVGGKAPIAVPYYYQMMNRTLSGSYRSQREAKTLSVIMDHLKEGTREGTLRALDVVGQRLKAVELAGSGAGANWGTAKHLELVAEDNAGLLSNPEMSSVSAAAVMADKWAKLKKKDGKDE